MADILEMAMMICFGASWPINIIKLWRSRSTKGASVYFYFLIVIGYLVGLGSKFIKLSEGISTPWYVWFFYILNAVMVAAGICIWIRNRRLEKRAA